MAELSQQRILLVFDRLGDAEPLPTYLVAEELEADESVVADRLAHLEDRGVLACGEDDGTTYWWAKRAPALDPDLVEELADVRPGETYTLDDIRERRE